jgi:hypothetical protein
MLPSLLGSICGNSGGGGGSSKYVYSFLSTNFTAGTLEVSAGAHGLGLNPEIHVFYLSSGDYVECTGEVQSEVDSSGNVFISVVVGQEFDGKVILD